MKFHKINRNFTESLKSPIYQIPAQANKTNLYLWIQAMEEDQTETLLLAPEVPFWELLPDVQPIAFSSQPML